MSSEWKESTWGKISKLEYGKAIRGYQDAKGKYPVYGTNGQIGWHDKSLSAQPGVIIGRKGAYRGIHYSDKPFFVIDTAFYLVPKNRINIKWAYYCLLTYDINRMDSGSAIPSTSRDEFYKLPVKIPSLTEQFSIAQFLSSLDDRIALLRETNATLESIAQAIFKSWFIDFDPVKAKQQGQEPQGMDAATAALFPDAFQDSELGPIPAGWEVVLIGDVCSKTIGGLWGKDNPEENLLVPVISLRGVDLENLRSFGFAHDAPIRWVKSSALKKRIIDDNHVLIAASGAGPCGRPLWAANRIKELYDYPVIFSNFVKRFECKDSAQAIYIDRILYEMRKNKEIWNYINGTSVPNLDENLLLKTKKIILPSREILVLFEEVTRVIFDRLYNKQSQTLASVRDALLPRLISGKLRLPEAEAMVEEALG